MSADDTGALAEHEVHLRSLWRELADKGIEFGIDWPGIARTLFADLDRLAARVEQARAGDGAVPPGPCWHDSGVTWPDGNRPRCELLAGHAGAHTWKRPNGGEAVWTTPTDPERWTTTLHVAFCNGELNHAAIHDGTVTEVAEAVVAKLRAAEPLYRVYPLGERDWPVALGYADRAVLESGYVAEWVHHFRKPDTPWTRS